MLLSLLVCFCFLSFFLFIFFFIFIFGLFFHSSPTIGLNSGREQNRRWSARSETVANWSHRVRKLPNHFWWLSRPNRMKVLPNSHKRSARKTRTHRSVSLSRIFLKLTFGYVRTVEECRERVGERCRHNPACIYFCRSIMLSNDEWFLMIERSTSLCTRPTCTTPSFSTPMRWARRWKKKIWPSRPT